ncbi:MAG: NAD-dependent epimerase/dehydratase family protein [Gammaproteobacteria bacterium]
MKTVLITGANGFVGSALCPLLAARGYRVTGAARAPGRAVDGVRQVFIGDIAGATDWRDHLAGVSVIVHLAARTQAAGGAENLTELRRTNVDATENLARQAAAAGVRRFVFASSIKVNGELTHGRGFTAGDAPSPMDAYAVSKRDAEQRLQSVAAETGLEVVSVRPPLVYGPGVGGNFLRLLQWVDRGLPLPVATVSNRRSLIALDNLVDVLLQCVHHPAAAGRTWLISDGEDLSTPQLLRLIAGAMNRRLRLWPAPLSMIRLMARAMGRRETFERLCGSLQVDVSEAREVLGWQPRVRADAAIARCVAWYLASRATRARGLRRGF